MQENLHSGTCHNLNVATDEIYQKNCTVVKIGIFSSYCNFDIILLNMYIFVIFCACSLRDTAMQVAKKCFKDEWEEKRVEFLPVEWRTWLTLDKGRSYNYYSVHSATC